MATLPELAEQRDKRRQDEMQLVIEKDLGALQARTGSNARSAGKTRKRAKLTQTYEAQGSGTRTSDSATRILVDPDSLRVVNPYGRMVVDS